MDRIRVLVVEDSLTVRKYLVEVLSSAPTIEVVGQAADGRAAIELCQALRPDVVTLDMMMPVMTGLAVTEYVMAFIPTPILIVSASLSRGEAFRTFEALAAGAVDVLDKPRNGAFDRTWEARFVAAVKLVSRIPVVTHPRARLGLDRPRGSEPSCTPTADTQRPPARSHALSRPHAGAPVLVAIGASTGGPSAVASILAGLPASFSTPIVVVVHIGDAFLAPLVEWLDGQSRHRVRIAVDGESLPRPAERCVLVAPSDRHLVVRHGRLRLTGDPERHSCRPSIDVFFESVAAEVGPRAVGCLLTGMGKDGAAGLLAMRRTGAVTLAQDEKTSVVFGMPREALLLGAADAALSIGDFPAALLAATGAVG